MNEELGTLTVVLKAMGLDVTTRGIQELEQVLKKTGKTAEELAADLGLVQTVAHQLGAANKVLLQLFSDGETTANRYATATERVGMQLAAVNQQYRAGTIGVQEYMRAVNDLTGKMAALERTSVPKLDVAGRMAMGSAGAGPSPDVHVGLDQFENSAKVFAVEQQITAETQRQLVLREKDNTLKLQANALLRQLETAEQAHERRMATFRELRQKDLINEAQLRRAAMQSEMAMRMQTHGKGGGQAAFQAAYGVQDFATVMAMGGGPGMAILSAQNNLSQMLMVSTRLNPALTATLATASALVAIGVGVWWEKYAHGANKAKTATDSVADSLRRLKDAMSQREADAGSAFGTSRLIERGSADDIGGGILDRTDSLESSRERLARITDEQRRAENAVRTNPLLRRDASASAVQQAMLEGVSGGPGIGSDEFMQNVARYRDQYIEQQVRANEQVLSISRERRDMQASILRTEREIKSLTDAQASAMQSAQALRDAEIKNEQRMRQRAAGESMLSMLERNRQSGLIAEGKASDTQFKAIGDFESFYGEVMGSMATDDQKQSMMDEFVDNQKSGINKQIDDLKKQPRGRDASFQSFSGFGQSLQLAMLKPQDEAKVQRQKQIDLLEQAKDELTKIREQAKNNLAVAAP